MQKSSLFEDDDQQEIITKVPVSTVKLQQKQENVDIPKVENISYAQKLSNNPLGGPQLPLLPKGMLITKPSQAK